MLSELRINDFVNNLSSDSTIPGGGSAAALAGTIGAGLITKVCNVTLNKSSHMGKDDSMVQLLEQCKDLCKEFTRLIDIDAETITALEDALKLEDSTEEKSHIKEGAIQAASRKAIQVPFKTLELAVDLLSIAREACENGDEDYLPQAGMAASIALATMDSAWYNIFANLGLLVEESFATEILERGELLIQEGEELYDTAMNTIDSRIS